MVVGIHADLVVAGESIHEAKEFMANCGVYYEVSEIDAESPFAIRFFDEYDVSQPFRVFHLPNCTCLEELSDLLINRFLSFWGKNSSFLLNRFEGWTDA